MLRTTQKNREKKDNFIERMGVWMIIITMFPFAPLCATDIPRKNPLEIVIAIMGWLCLAGFAAAALMKSTDLATTTAIVYGIGLILVVVDLAISR